MAWVICDISPDPVVLAAAASYECSFTGESSRATALHRTATPSPAPSEVRRFRRYQHDQATRTVQINNVAPTATARQQRPDQRGQPRRRSASATPSDPSPADTTAGFRYAFDCDGRRLAARATSHGSSHVADDDLHLPRRPPADEGRQRRVSSTRTAASPSTRRPSTLNNITPTVHVHERRHDGQRVRRHAPHVHVHGLRPRRRPP